MRIYSLARVLSFPFIITLAVLLYLEFVAYREIGWWMLIPLTAVIMLYLFHGQIDFWWQEKHPIPLEPQERRLLEANIPYYRKLDGDGKAKFESRLSLYINGREWKNVGTSELKNMPDDMKVIIASQVIMLTYNDDDYLLGDFDRIYTYKHPFPSPRYQYLHTVETNLEDGMVLYSMEHVLPGVTKPDQYYNIGMHGYAEAYIKQNPALPYPDIAHLTWEPIEQITGFSSQQILGVLGHKDVDLMPVLIMCYFTYPERTREVLGMEYLTLVAIFGDPMTA